MSKDDFRDRLKSYSLEPEHGEWVKMEQLLDADKDNRKGIVWWKFGAVFALLLIPASIYLMSSTSSQEDKPYSSSSNFVAETPVSSKINNVQEATTSTKKHSPKVKNDVTSAITTSQVQVNNTLSNSINRNIKNESVYPQATLQVKSTKYTPTPPINNIFSRPQASNTSQSTSSNNPKEALDHEEVVLNPEVEVDQLLLAEINSIENIEFASLDTEEYGLPELDPTPFTKVYPEFKKRAWYFVAGVGAKYPLVDIQEVQVGTYIPSQEFFPSYLAEAGIGKHFGKLSAEVGASASLYQYKLERTLNDEAQWGTQSNGYPLESMDRLNEENNTFLINKFAVISPYLRGQYSFNLKKKFLLGIHSMISFNRKIDLPNQIVSNQFVDNSAVGLEEASFVGALTESRRANIIYDIGFSLEKLFAKRGRMAIDFSYGLAAGSLENGSYSVLRETVVESNGAYSISGTGPKVKFRYYL